MRTYEPFTVTTNDAHISRFRCAICECPRATSPASIARSYSYSVDKRRSQRVATITLILTLTSTPRHKMTPSNLFFCSPQTPTEGRITSSEPDARIPPPSSPDIRAYIHPFEVSNSPCLDRISETTLFPELDLGLLDEPIWGDLDAPPSLLFKAEANFDALLKILRPTIEIDELLVRSICDIVDLSETGSDCSQEPIYDVVGELESGGSGDHDYGDLYDSGSKASTGVVTSHEERITIRVMRALRKWIKSEAPSVEGLAVELAGLVNDRPVPYVSAPPMAFNWARMRGSQHDWANAETQCGEASPEGTVYFDCYSDDDSDKENIPPASMYTLFPELWPHQISIRSSSPASTSFRSHSPAASEDVFEEPKGRLDSQLEEIPFVSIGPPALPLPPLPSPRSASPVSQKLSTILHEARACGSPTPLSRPQRVLSKANTKTPTRRPSSSVRQSRPALATIQPSATSMPINSATTMPKRKGKGNPTTPHRSATPSTSRKFSSRRAESNDDKENNPLRTPRTPLSSSTPSRSATPHTPKNPYHVLSRDPLHLRPSTIEKPRPLPALAKHLKKGRMI
ncbi:hypothetical protein BOTBODRAFT_374983 [Botryobasidium botryosum FD-172 SS1]|uniref:Uncharacterized protein n=1 Tax=Botryobasidium botryosum (strain FD-172 SS1) TaxID=930990 RepID=A0A067MYE6_BOTB1|nr:hypothetical protein BOTBODRAFT_374983 [Botryobasidium botryosum FD-172 SS1]